MTWKADNLKVGSQSTSPQELEVGLSQTNWLDGVPRMTVKITGPSPAALGVGLAGKSIPVEVQLDADEAEAFARAILAQATQLRAETAQEET